ncbi:MAG TPA: DNA topoisomerase I [Candidatus Nanoarchaeia archaeon]|nr:DNA topoisomerase I [Candidatus Nanoarchaeia archaeon]
MYELIITEKPQAAKKIAEALADGKPLKDSEGGVPFYKVTHNNTDIVVGCAVGHLFTIAEEKKGKWTYPIFAVDWKPTSEVRKDAKFSAKYLNTLKKLAKEAKVFTVATDYDIEGEVIGWNVVRYVCKQKDARRMKFSTLTKDEIVRAYAQASKTLDWGQAYAGETRHFLDYYYGINLSRALSLAVKAAGTFKILSAGRVQGPALKIIVDKEKEIQAFQSEPYWQIELQGKVRNAGITAQHAEDKFWDKAKATKAYERAKGHDGKITGTERKQFKQAPPTPFDLTTLQTESYRSLRIQPKDTLQVAQSLYLAGLISYPRTSSQKLPPEIDYKKILSGLQKNDHYAKLAQLVLKGPLKPNEGKKSDPAHPAIYPTGQQAALEGRDARVYDLIVRRFLATFSEPAMRETVTVSIDVHGEPFVTSGTRTVVPGWHVFYGPHVKLEEIELPPVQQGDEVRISALDLQDCQTQPPKRYTPASIIKELEKRNLGTKATRSAIVEALYERGYAFEKSIQATELGMRTCAVLEKYCPQILDEELTRRFEEEMEEVRERKRKEEDVLTEAKDILIKILGDFKQKEMAVGTELAKATKETRDEVSYIGACINCKTGELQIRSGRFGKFIACNKYPDCKTTFSIPKGALVKAMRKECEQCKYPMLLVIRARKRPQPTCLNVNCPSKGVSDALAKDIEAITNGSSTKSCPKCTGPLVVRKSLYGTFLGCKAFPKCRYIERVAKPVEVALPLEEEEPATAAATAEEAME